MSPATAGDDIDLDDGEDIKLGTGDDGLISVASDNLVIENITSDKDIVFEINDGGTANTEAMRIVGATQSVQIDNININDNTISSTDADGNILLVPNGSGGIGNTSSLTDCVFRIGSELTGTLNAENPISEDHSMNSANLWQSFTPTVSGYLTKIGWQRYSSSAQEVDVYIRFGQGSAGTILASKTSVWNVPNWTYVEFDAPAYLSSGQLYTIYIHGVSENIAWMRNNDYVDGRAHDGASLDGVFKTYISESYIDFSIKNDTGSIGVNTQNPTEILDVNGNINVTAVNAYKIGGTTLLQQSQFDLDNLSLDGNTISSTDTDGNILLTPNGTGDVEIDGEVSIGDGTYSWDHTPMVGIEGALEVDGAVHFDGTVSITTGGGSIDNTAIGSSVASTGKFTTLESSGQYTNTVADGTAPMVITSTTLVSSLNADLLDGQSAPTGDIVGTSDTQTLTNKTVSGGTIDSAAIGSSTASTGAFTTLASSGDTTIGDGDDTITLNPTTSVSFSDKSITNVNDIALDSISADGGSSFSMGSNWTSVGRIVADLGSVTTADINGGTIDGTTIGGSSAAAGTFTVLTATTDINVDNLKLDASTISSTNSDGNILLTPDGSGEVLISTGLDVGDADTAGTVAISDGTSNTVTLTASGIGTNYSLTLPVDDGTAAGQVLTTNGSGVLSWAADADTTYWGQSGTELSPATAGDDIDLDDGEDIKLGTGDDGLISVASDNLVIENITSDKDIVFEINDGGTANTEAMRIVGATQSVQIDNINIDGNTISSTDTDGNIVLLPDGNGGIGNTTDLTGSLFRLTSGTTGILNIDIAITGAWDHRNDWQSFKPTVSGYLTRVGWYGRSGAPSGTAHMVIKTGEGISGTSLALKTSIPIGGGWRYVDFEDPAYLTAGETYTIYIYGESAELRWEYAITDVYPDGRSAWNAGGDCMFRTYISQNYLDFSIKRDSGAVGINTLNPTEILDVNGNINLAYGMAYKIDGTTLLQESQFDLDNLRLDGNTISSTDTNGNILLTPNGTGDVEINGEVSIGDGTYSWDHTPMVGIEGGLEVDSPSYFDDQVTIGNTSVLAFSDTTAKIYSSNASPDTIEIEAPTVLIDGALEVYNTSVIEFTDASAKIYSSNASPDTIEIEAPTVLLDGNVEMPDVYGDTSSGGSALYVNSAGVVGTATSLTAAKVNIQNIPDTSWIYDLRPVIFNYRKQDIDGKYTDQAEPYIEYGLLIEEAKPVNPDLIGQNSKDEDVVLHYHKLVPVLLKTIQELRQELDELKQKVEKLEKDS